MDETDFHLAFCSVVRGRRHACGLSCEELAVASGVQLTDLNEIEDGRKAASLADLFLIATALGTTPQLLVRDVRHLLWLGWSVGRQVETAVSMVTEVANG